jgi:hypothetical protein
MIAEVSTSEERKEKKSKEASNVGRIGEQKRDGILHTSGSRQDQEVGAPHFDSIQARHAIIARRRAGERKSYVLVD